MHRSSLFAAALAIALSACAVGKVPVSSAEDDVAVFRAILQRTCSDTASKPIVVSDTTPPARTYHLPRVWASSSQLADQLARRAETKFKWPHDEVCARVRIVDASRVDALFARDNRKPPGWDNFFNEFPDTSGLMKISLPAFTPERDRAVLYMESTCGLLCGSGFYIELTKGQGRWQTSRLEAAWIS